LPEAGLLMEAAPVRERITTDLTEVEVLENRMIHRLGRLRGHTRGFRQAGFHGGAEAADFDVFVYGMRSGAPQS
jgi:hypothetical protein